MTPAFHSSRGTPVTDASRTHGLRSVTRPLPALVLVLVPALAGFGAWSYRRDRVREPLTGLAALGAGAAAAVLCPLSWPLFAGALPIVPIGAAVAVVCAASWVGLGRYGVA